MKKLIFVIIIVSIIAGCSKEKNSNFIKDSGVSSASSDHYTLGDSLFFELNDGRIVKLVNKPFTGNNDIQSSVTYKYIGFDQELNSYKLEYSGYENGIVYINKISGSISHLSNNIVFSPNRKYICSWREDLSLERTGNLIEIYEIGKNGLNLVFSDAPEKWGPENAQWLDDSSLIFNRVIDDDNAKKIVSIDTLRLSGMNFKLISSQK